MSNTSFIVSGTFILCFSITVCGAEKGPAEGKVWGCKEQRKVGPSPARSPNTDLSGQRLLGDHFQGVDHGDVAQPPGDGQSAVPVLENTDQSQVWGIPFSDQEPEVGCEQTHVGELVGRRSVVQQQVDDVCVPLLSSLMKGCVTVLQEGRRALGLPVHAESATAGGSFLPLSLR